MPNASNVKQHKNQLVALVLYVFFTRNTVKCRPNLEILYFTYVYRSRTYTKIKLYREMPSALKINSEAI